MSELASSCVSLTRLAPDHAEALAALHARCFPVPWSAEDFRRFAEYPCYYGLAAWHAERTVGFVSVTLAGTESDILSLGVDPDFRRRNIATTILSQLRTDLAGLGIERLFLEVATSNTAARAFYRHRGFRVAGHRRAYYQTPAGPQDALILMMPIAAGRAPVRSSPNRQRSS